jgi:hypothetical protein
METPATVHSDIDDSSLPDDVAHLAGRWDEALTAAAVRARGLRQTLAKYRRDERRPWFDGAEP